jgi:L-asparagine transporter-like permease
VGAVFAVCSVLPWTAVRTGESPFTAALAAMGVPWAAALMSFVILTAVLSCLNSAFYVSSRMLFVLAGRGDAPVSLVRANASGVPTRAVLLSGAVGLAGVVAAIASPGAVFAFLLNASGATMLIVYLVIAATQVRLRRARESASVPRSAIEVWGFPWLSYGAMAAMVAVLAGMAATPALRSQFYASLVPLAISACTALALARRRARAFISPTEG